LSDVIIRAVERAIDLEREGRSIECINGPNGEKYGREGYEELKRKKGRVTVAALHHRKSGSWVVGLPRRGGGTRAPPPHGRQAVEFQSRVLAEHIWGPTALRSCLCVPKSC
jgi:hypothetical protein